MHNILFLLALTFSAAHSMLDPTEKYLHEETLSSGNVIVYWKYTEKDITFEVHGNTTGWVGIGFSPNGGMTGADIVVGWVKEGEVKVTDRHGTYNAFPPLDQTQNIEVVDGKECDGWTMIKFKRQIASCEENQDREITDGTVRLIWAYGSDDPSDADIDTSHYHGTNRGTKSMYLLKSNDALTEDLPEGPTYNTIDLLEKNFEVPQQDTYYKCKLFRMPALTKKHHVVKVDPIIQRGNEAYVHHITLHACTEFTGVEADADCSTPGCDPFIVAWAVGGGALLFPEEAGYSIGSSSDVKHVSMTIHYDNPGEKSGIVDNSGLRLTYTDTLRQYDTGVFMVGTSLRGFEHFIPPGAESFLSVGFCPQECLQKEMEASGNTNVTMFNVFLHSHIAGRAMKLRHYRDGEELPYIATDDNYDFNYQIQRYVDRVELRSTDILRTDCVYNTEDRSDVTQAGQSTREEMCQSYISYYPKFDLAVCSTTPYWKDLWSYFGIVIPDNAPDPSNSPRLEDFNVTVEGITEEGSTQGRTALDVITEFNWTEEAIDKFSLDCLKMNQTYQCRTAHGIERRYDLKWPEIESEYRPTSKNCTEPSGELGQTREAGECDIDPGLETTTTDSALLATAELIWMNFAFSVLYFVFA